ncbi:translational activator of cytochrome c oxidase 1 [Calliopsis andreniformis]|uniref:translational activator of cytochrome c oxidase 1 n=1 Tax=Calliopsis andreniformis TaxID=337506 RepID=UPI003FCD9472
MKFRINMLIYNNYKNILFQETRRYAGHSKWQNIKHTKETQDAARAALFRSLTNKMKIAITETGIIDPDKNLRLAQLIEQAKKASMPVTTIKTFLEKMKNKTEKSQIEILPIRGPGGCTLILYIASSNITYTKLGISAIVKKVSAQVADPSTLQMFDCACYVVASKECNLDQAMEDAININAQDVQEIKDNDETCFEFKCEFLSSSKSISQLRTLGYSILSTEDICIPQYLTELNEEDLKLVKKLKDKLMNTGDIEKIEDNIAEYDKTSE